MISPARVEVARFPKLQAAREMVATPADAPAEDAPAPAVPFSPVSLFVAGWVMASFFIVQALQGEGWTTRGASSSKAILEQGEWWRTLTALTLHADLSHFGANLATLLLFAAFLVPRLGPGVAWLLIVLTGALGNFVNAWGYRGAGHASIGASTAVFGTLGLLVGLEVMARARGRHLHRLWHLIVPLGGGLGLLAFFGVGDPTEYRTDHWAHAWGFGVGLVLGAGAALNRYASLPASIQRAAAAAAVGLLLLAWWMASNP